MHMLSSQNIGGTKPVLNQQPNKYLMFMLIGGFSNPFEDWMSPIISQELIISLLTSENGTSPNIEPCVSAIRRLKIL